MNDESIIETGASTAELRDSNDGEQGENLGGTPDVNTESATISIDTARPGKINSCFFFVSILNAVYSMFFMHYS